MNEIENEKHESQFSGCKFKSDTVSGLSNLRQAALNYAAKSWAVLPLKAGKKAPQGEIVTHGHHDATIDEAQIRDWWSQEPIANIGIRVGPDSNLLVLDVDNKNGKNGSEELEKLEREYGPLPATYTIRTPTGGLHYYFTYPAEFLDQRLRKELVKANSGLDLKFKGYVVAPPSVVKEGCYVVTDSNAVVDSFPWTELCVKQDVSLQEWDHIKRIANVNGESIVERYGLSMSDVLTLPPGATPTKDGYTCKHPTHGAATGHNFYVNTQRNLFCCYHHDTGGDPLTWVAIREGFIHCEDAGPLDRETIKQCLDVLRNEGLLSETIAEVPKECRQSVDEFAQWLIQHPKTLIAYYRSLIDDYHQGEWSLKTMMWRQVHRIAYHSAMALLHSDLTGPSRGGKTSLMLRFLTLLPSERKEVLTTLTPKAIWYKTVRQTKKLVNQVDKQTGEDKVDERGNPLKRVVSVRESDPTFYVGKVIVIMELSEMKDFGVLKALADEYEIGEYIHSTVIDQNSVELKIEGPRCVMTTSVKGIQNDIAKQVLNRFIQTPLDEPTEKGTRAKLEMVADHDLNESTIGNDPRLLVLKRALELLWTDGYNIKVTPPSEAVRMLVKAIDKQLNNDGFNITQIRDFHTLALNGAFEKRFARSNPRAMQIQEEDVLEAWYILTTFGNFARGNLTRAEYKLLSEVPNDPNAAVDASDLREKTGLGVATINDALRVKDDPVKGQGKFLEYGYVNYVQGERASLFYRVPDGDEAVKQITREIEVDGRSFKPLNPVLHPYKDLLHEMPDSAIFGDIR